jgi:uncharacterized protein (TIGR00297 family)
MLDRQTNYLFAYVLLLLFILAAQPDDRVRIIAGFVLSVAIVAAVYMLGFLSLDALMPATLIGVIAYGFGEWSNVAILAVFFISASLLTFLNDHKVRIGKSDDPLQSRRTGKQAWSNAWWFSTFIIASFLWESQSLLIAASCAMATATSDTWATEVGLLPRNHRTVSILNFKTVPPGTDGGISLFGTIAALLGSALIGAVFMLFSYQDQIAIFIIITISGFVGCLADSILGALLQRPSITVNLTGAKLLPHSMGNNKVNWLSTGIGGLIGLCTFYVMI